MVFGHRPQTRKEVSASSSTLTDRRVQYTVPVINDPNTSAIVTDSWEVTEHLDKTYPEKPIFPQGSKGLIKALDLSLLPLAGALFRFAVLRSSQILNERHLEHFILTREAYFGAKVNEWSPEGPTCHAYRAQIEKYFGIAKQFYDKGEGRWLMRDTFSSMGLDMCTNSNMYFIPNLLEHHIASQMK